MSSSNDGTDSSNDSDSETELWFEDDDDYPSINDDTAAGVRELEPMSHTSHIDDNESKVIRFFLMFIFLWQSLFKLSNTGVQVLLSFFARFLSLVAKIINVDKLNEFAKKLPKTLYLAKKFLGTGQDIFLQYVTCPKCSSIYNIADCMEKVAGKSISKKCSHIEFPHHPQVRFRQPCGTVLMKTVKTSSGTYVLYPRSVYCYSSLLNTMQSFLKRPGFVEKCQEWKNISTIPGVYQDVYDGSVWKDFLVYDGVPFLSLPYNFGFILNIDWFQPYSHTQYSLGAIYLAILNLPRQERYLIENIILLGIIPGPKEPKKHVNSFLTPLMAELRELWQGVILQSSGGNSVVVRGALLCVACDLPASRKVSGFVGPMAQKGCSKCTLTFPTHNFGDKPDFSNFNRNEWLPRNNKDHCEISFAYNACKTNSHREKLEQLHGIRYSVLCELPYFNASRMTVIDPMHNLLLGSAKYVLKIWQEREIISKEHFSEIQCFVDSFTSPADVGRIPLKIASGFSGFTAEQWKNWVIYYSLPALKQILPFRLYNHWHLFVKACYLLCRRTITNEELLEADTLIMEYCQSYVEIYGKECCTPNLHLHGHLASCIRDYGPVYAFWLFSFERLNGVLGSYHSNNQAISVQVMRKFLNNTHYQSKSLEWPQEFEDDLHSLLSKATYCKGSLMFATLENALHSPEAIKLVEALPPAKEFILPSHVKHSLIEDIAYYYSNDTCSVCNVLAICIRCKAIKIGSFVLGSEHSKFTTSSRLLVYTTNGQVKLAQVHYYIRCNVMLSNEEIDKVWLVAVSYYVNHSCKVWFGHPVQVWSKTTETDIHFIPLNKISSRIVCGELTVNFGRYIGEQNVLVVIPIESH